MKVKTKPSINSIRTTHFLSNLGSIKGLIKKVMVGLRDSFENFTTKKQISQNNKVKVRKKHIKLDKDKEYETDIDGKLSKTSLYRRYKEPIKSNPKMNIKLFRCFRTLGQGSFGRVVLAYCLQTRKFYAIKLLNKENVVKHKQQNHTFNEKRILYACNHPNIARINFAFKDNSNLYFGIQYYLGGDLYRHLKSSNRFSEDTARFYASQILSSLDYLHRHHIVYRDLKPENILISSKGYLKLIDFGFAKLILNGRTGTVCGTPDYLSPEVISSKDYGLSVDWWAFGIFIYELNAGVPPFKGKDTRELYENILARKFRCPLYFSPALTNLIHGLLVTDPTMRLGCLRNGRKDIFEHEWFENFNWDKIYSQEIKAPYVPQPKSYLLWALEKSKKKEEPIKIAAIDTYATYFKDF